MRVVMLAIKPEWRWILGFALVDFANRILFGAYGTLMGPVQPYMARNVNVKIETISWLWTFGGIAWLLGTIASAATFKQNFRTSTSKLVFFAVTSIIMAITTYEMPFSTTFLFLCFHFSLRQFIAAAWETAGAGILVYTMGPIESRILVMCHHFVVGLGFWIGPVMFQHILPQEQRGEELCQRNASDIPIANEDFQGNIAVPFLFVAMGHLVCCVGYIILIFMPWEMPVFQEAKSRSDSGPGKGTQSLWQEIGIMITVISFYVVSCGSERLFQTMEFIFGLCGPLKLTPKDAVFTDEMYNGGFMLGRLLSMDLVRRFPPQTLLKFSTLGCLLSSLLTAMGGDKLDIILYLGAGLFGFFVSAQFGATFSWTAEHLDVVGNKAALFHVGCTLGSSLMATSAGYLFQQVHPMSVWYMNLICAIMQVTLFFVLRQMFANNDDSRSSIQYSQLKTRESEEVDN